MEQMLERTIQTERQEKDEARLLALVSNDAHGLCFGAAPKEEAAYAGSYQSIVGNASRLFSEEYAPIVLIETNKRCILVRQCDEVVLAASQQEEGSPMP